MIKNLKWEQLYQLLVYLYLYSVEQFNRFDQKY